MLLCRLCTGEIQKIYKLVRTLLKQETNEITNEQQVNNFEKLYRLIYMAPEHFRRQFSSGTQRGIFRVRACFLEQRHFHKSFMYGIQKKSPAEKILMLFLHDTLKTVFYIRIQPIDAHKQGAFFQSQGTILFLKKGKGDLPTLFYQQRSSS